MSCSIGLELTLDALFGEQLARLAGRRYPFAGSFELTERCNLACAHCYINQPAGSAVARARELSTSQVMAVLDQVADAGCLHLLLTGGEILLRSDFPQLYRHAVQRGLLLTLFTNGTLLTPRMADYLAEWRPHSVEITLYGATQETCERVTRVPGSHARCLHGIDLALARGLPLALKTVVLRANQHEVQQMKAFAAGLGVDFRYDGVVWPRTGGGDGPLAQRLSPGEIVALDATDAERAREWEKLSGRAFDPSSRGLVYICGAGRHAFHVDCEGRLSPCIMARSPSFDLLQAGFRHAWQHGIGPAIEEKRRRPSPCATCRAGAVCTQCPGWSQMVHGDNETPVDFVCDLAHLRASRFCPPAACLQEEERGRRERQDGTEETV